MLEICLSGFLITSAAICVLLWRALAVAKRADFGLYGVNDVCGRETSQENVHLTSLLPSADD